MKIILCCLAGLAILGGGCINIDVDERHHEIQVAKEKKHHNRNVDCMPDRPNPPQHLRHAALFSFEESASAGQVRVIDNALSALP